MEVDWGLWIWLFIAQKATNNELPVFLCVFNVIPPGYKDPLLSIPCCGVIYVYQSGLLLSSLAGNSLIELNVSASKNLLHQ